ISSYENDSDEGSIAALRDFTDSSARDLDNLETLVPAPARDDLLDAARLLSRLDRDARDACADCSSLPAVAVSDSIRGLAGTAKNLLELPPAQVPGNDPGGRV